MSKIDCVIHRELCLQQQIWGYPTLRLFVDGDVHGDYRGDRTVLEMVHWLAVQEEEHKSHLGEEHHNVKLADEGGYQVQGHIGLHSFNQHSRIFAMMMFSGTRITKCCRNERRNDRRSRS